MEKRREEEEKGKKLERELISPRSVVVGSRRATATHVLVFGNHLEMKVRAGM